ACLALLVSGLAIGLSAANLFYRDVKYLVEIGLTFAIFFTPVLYETDMMGAWKTWLLLNPVAPLLDGLHASIALGQAPSLGWLLYSLSASLVVAFAAAVLFFRVEPIFADSI